MLVDFSTNPSLSGSKLKRQQMSADNISKENGTHNAFHKMQECQETQKKVTVKYPEEKQKDTSQQNDCQKLRRSYRSPVKPRRFEPEEIKISIKCKKKSTQRSRIFRECFGSDTESDGVKDNSDRNVKISRQDNCTKSKKKKRESQKRESPEKMENRRKNTLSLENHYTKSETKSPYLKNERKGKTFVELELRRSNRTPVKPRRFEPDIIKSTQKIDKRKVGDKAKRDTLGAEKNCQSEINSKKEVPLKLEEKKSKSNISKYVYPSSEEIAEMKRRENEQMRTNREMKEILKGLIKVPEKVKILSLNSMTADQILDTFPKYKAQLDVIFRELCSEPKVTGYNGINHFSVIELIDDVKQLKMMHKLGEIYETDHDGVSMYPMLFANALMPGWLVYIFKDKYNLTFSEAVTHLDKQRQYKQYLSVEDNL